MLGLLTDENWFAGEADNSKRHLKLNVLSKLAIRRVPRDFAEADRTQQLAEQGIKLLLV